MQRKLRVQQWLMLITVLLVSLSYSVGARAATSPLNSPAAALSYLYLPLVGKTANTSGPVTEPPTPEPPTAQSGALFAETQWKTSNADITLDKAGGMHMAYYYYEASGSDAPTSAVYRYCPRACAEAANWHGVELGQEINETQLALTPSGKPRLLLRATSTVQNGGKDYLYAACDANCTDRANWQVTTVATSYGTDIFDTSDDSVPQRSFALDPQGRPRFVFLDRNYVIEPDHYGLFYTACNTQCTNAQNWTQTLISAVVKGDFSFDWEVVTYPVLTFTSQGQPRLLADMYPLQGGTAGIYYFGCDKGCDQFDNWQRIYLFDRGAGTKVSWDLEMDSHDRPRIAFYKGEGGDVGEKLYYVYCNENCFASQDSWGMNGPGLPAQNGKHPDLALDAQGRPRIAYIDSADGLSYTWCNTDCEGEGGWTYQQIESGESLYSAWPVPYPLSCDASLWQALTPVMQLDAAGNPAVAFDATYYARCLYQDPSTPNDPPYYHFHLVMRAVRATFFPQP